MPEYEVLRVIWWLLMGIVLIGFAVMDGFDLGAVAFVRVLPQDDAERRALIETFEPYWEGNQVWLVLGGGAVFAAWPLLYAASFSGFYFAILLVLLALILRPVALNVRNKSDSPRWRGTWDGLLTFSALVPALIFGVAFGNLFLGVPLRYDATMRITYDGGLIGLLRPFALVTGLVSMSMLLLHGAAYLAMKSESPLAERAERAMRWLAPAYVILYVARGHLARARRARAAYRQRRRRDRFQSAAQIGVGRRQLARRRARWRRVDGGDRGHRRRHRRGVARRPSRASRRLRRHVADRCRDDLLGRIRVVPVPDAVEPRSAQQPDGVGRLVEPLHAVADADRHADPAADRAGLHRLGVSRDARACLARACPQVPRDVLTMWYFTWVLGLGLAVSFAILNAMWLEVHEGEPVGEDPLPDREHPR